MSDVLASSRRSFIRGAGALFGAAAGATVLGSMLERRASAVATGAQTLWGVWQPGAPWDGSSPSFANVEALERSLGSQPDILHWYAGWAHAARPDLGLIGAVLDRGALPLISWEPWDYTAGVDQPRYALARIAGGRFDRYVDRWARDLASLRRPVYLRFAHEMDGDSYPWSVRQNGNTAAAYVAAWRRVVTRFRAAGASNVRFVWCPNVTWSGSSRVAYTQVFPGDTYVDVVGLDGYNGGRDVDWGGWLSFPAIFDYSLAQVETISARPVWICEVASAETGGDKAAWIAGMWSAMAARPRIGAAVWFNELREADWRMDSSDGALEAMRIGLGSR